MLPYTNLTALVKAVDQVSRMRPLLSLPISPHDSGSTCRVADRPCRLDHSLLAHLQRPEGNYHKNIFGEVQVRLELCLARSRSFR